MAASLAAANASVENVPPRDDEKVSALEAALLEKRAIAKTLDALITRAKQKKPPPPPLRVLT